MFRAILKAVVAGAVVAGASVASANAQTTIRFADYGPNRGARAENVQWFFSEITKRTEGRVKIDEHWGGALLGAKDSFKGVQSGVADLATVTATYAPQALFGLRVGDLPITTPNEVKQGMALYDLATSNEALVKEFDKAGVVYIANYTVGPIQMVCKGLDVKSFADLVGKKVRYTAEYGKILADLGVVTVSLSTPEIYQGLATGLVNCAQTYAYTTLSYKLNEVSDQFIVFDLGTLGANSIFMNKRSFEKLDPRDQKTIRDLGRELTELNATNVREANQKAIAGFPKGEGGHVLEVVTLSDQDRARIEAASQPYIDAWVKESADHGLDGAAIVKAYQDLLEQKAN